MFCDGLGLASITGNAVLLETYLFLDEQSNGCYSQVQAESSGSQLNSVGGIYDEDVSDNQVYFQAAIFPAACDDLGLGSYTGPVGSSYSAPAGAYTVASAYGQAGTRNIYGVVTAVAPWSTTYSGTLYLQDPATSSPAPMSGVAVYFPKADAASFGTPPVRGDVVEVTNATWSPYNGQAQFAAGTTTTVAVIGSAPLPVPVVVGSADVGPVSSAAQQYMGMRVTVSDAPFTVTGGPNAGNCPNGLTVP
jgi:hypothetical protein